VGKKAHTKNYPGTHKKCKSSLVFYMRKGVQVNVPEREFFCAKFRFENGKTFGLAKKKRIKTSVVSYQRSPFGDVCVGCLMPLFGIVG
jgi:hypothetical protein